jgi:hypothetical protein
MHHSAVFCRRHGLFSSHAVSDNVCPTCGCEAEIPASFASLADSLDLLIDPQQTVKTLLSLRQIALAAHAGLLTPEQAARGATRVAANLAHLFGVNISESLYLELAEALGEVLKARSLGRTFARAEPNDMHEVQSMFD